MVAQLSPWKTNLILVLHLKVKLVSYSAFLYWVITILSNNNLPVASNMGSLLLARMIMLSSFLSMVDNVELLPSN